MKFTAGQQLITRNGDDQSNPFTGIVVKRTAKTAVIKTRMCGEKRCKIYTDDNGVEFVFPFGQHSMAVVFKADR